MHSSVGVVDLDAQPEQTHGASSDEIRRVSELLADMAQLRADLREGDLVIEGQQARRDALDVEMTALRDSLDVERAALLAERTARLAEIERR